MNSSQDSDDIHIVAPLPEDFADPNFIRCLQNLSPGAVSHNPALLYMRQFLSIETVLAVEGGVDGGIVGTATFFIEPKLTHGGTVVIHVEDVAVRPDREGRGVGRKLMEYMQVVAYQAGKGLVRRIELSCKEDKVGFYEKLGYKRAGVYMRLDLPHTSVAEREAARNGQAG